MHVFKSRFSHIKPGFLISLLIFFSVLVLVGMYALPSVVAAPDITANYSGINDATLSTYLDDGRSIIFFFSNTCPHCKKVEDSGVLQAYVDEYLIPVHMIEAGNAKGLFTALCNRSNDSTLICNAVPTMFLLDVNKSNQSVRVMSVQGDADIMEDGDGFIRGFYLGIEKNSVIEAQNTQKVATTVTTLLLTGLADSVNPCIMSILALLIMQIALVGSMKRILKLGIIFISTIFLTYMIMGVLMLYISHVMVLNLGNELSSSIGWYVLWAIVLMLIFAAIVNIKDYFYYGQGLSFQIPKKYEGQIHSLVKKLSLPSILTLAVLITIIEFPCSGFMYVGFVSFLKTQNYSLPASIGLLVIYNVLFVLPLIIMVGLAYFGTDPKKIDHFRVKYRDVFRLIMGVALAILAIYIMFAQNLIRLP